jgi:hypothetical protein
MLPVLANNKDPWDEKEWRIMVAGYYRQSLQKPLKKYWHECNGTIANICDTFKLPEGSNERVKRVLDYVTAYQARGQVLLIPQVRPAHKYPISPWEMIHLPLGDNALCAPTYTVYTTVCNKSLTATYQ